MKLHTIKKLVAVFGGVLSLAATLATPSAYALPALEFDDLLTAGGTITYNGTGGPAVGTDIIFDRVTGIGTPLNAGAVRVIVGGLLNFTTGANTSEGVVSTFGGGGSFVLTGTVIAPDLSVIASGVLLSGFFTGVSIINGVGSAQAQFSGAGIDSKNQDLLNYFGITGTVFNYANTEITMDSTAGADGSFSGSIANADLTNTEAAVPDGGTTLALFGLALVGVESLRRKLRK